MAVRFSANTDRYSTTLGTLPGNNTAVTITWWQRFWGRYMTVPGDGGSDPATFRTAWVATNGTTGYVSMGTTDNGVRPAVYSGSAVTLDTPPGTDFTPLQWYRMAFTSSPSTSGLPAKLWWAAGAGGTLSSAVSSETDFVNTATTTLYIGGDNTTEFLEGSIANFKHYNAVLTQSEIEAELASYTAVRSSNLIRHYKLIDPETTDYSGNGNTLTAGSIAATKDDADAPPIEIVLSEQTQNSRAYRALTRGGRGRG